MRLVWGTVLAVASQASDIQRLDVSLDDGTEGDALAYPAFTGQCSAGDRVLLNTTAVDLDLGTGGTHFVVARHPAGADAPSGVALDRPSAGHIMKLRYTPLQIDVCSVEEQASPHHAAMSAARDLFGMPVACCGLHSHVPLVAAAVKQMAPELRVAYVMTDFGALPIALSEIVRKAVAARLIDATITAGQAFGGDYESVNVHSALLAARHVARADVAIVAIGPGVVGTATPLGHGGVAQGEAINSVASLGGTPVAALRLSFADRRARHHGVSHHTLVALNRIALASAYVPVPHLPDEFSEIVEEKLEEAGVWERHTRVTGRAGHDRGPDLRGVTVSTMGRTEAEDPAFFSAAYAAGEVCARIALGEIEGPVAKR
ncbi:MAG: DUF3866 family protein [Actinomycetota bacterium]|nr:DUF3866 family protein [Actinomycetota bacterium]